MPKCESCGQEIPKPAVPGWALAAAREWRATPYDERKTEEAMAAHFAAHAPKPDAGKLARAVFKGIGLLAPWNNSIAAATDAIQAVLEKEG